MIDPVTTFLKRLEAVRLSSNERLQMRERLALYADMHGAVPAAMPSASFFAFLASRRFSTYAGAFVALLVLGASVTLGAEGSVPGDALYSVKTDVNEPIMTALATTPAGQARVASDLATRRIDEAVRLASRGELTPDKRTYLAAQFNERVEVAAQKTDELATIDAAAADDVKANLAANLAGEAQALGAIAAKSPDGSSQLLSVVVATSESISNAAGGGLPEVAIAEEETTASSTEAVEAEHPGAAASVRIMSAMIAPVASTTASSTEKAPRPALTGRFTKRLRFASTTLEARFASTTLKATRLLLPKVDVAIPALPAAPSAVTETGDAEGLDVHLGD